jgi:hypothetical protein
MREMSRGFRGLLERGLKEAEASKMEGSDVVAMVKDTEGILANRDFRPDW